MFYWTVQHRVELLPLIGAEIEKFIRHCEEALEGQHRDEQLARKLTELTKLKIRKLGEFYEKHYDDYRAWLIPLYQAALRNAVVMNAGPTKPYPQKEASVQPSSNAEYRSMKPLTSKQPKQEEVQVRESSLTSKNVRTTIPMGDFSKKPRANSHSLTTVQPKLNRTVEVVSIKPPDLAEEAPAKTVKQQAKRPSTNTNSPKAPPPKLKLSSPSNRLAPSITLPTSTKNIKPVSSTAVLAKPKPATKPPTKQEFIELLRKQAK